LAWLSIEDPLARSSPSATTCLKSWSTPVWLIANHAPLRLILMPSYLLMVHLLLTPLIIGPSLEHYSTSPSHAQRSLMPCNKYVYICVGIN
jgi:hypothetical protein